MSGSNFEGIVRPFQEGDVFSGRVLPPVQEILSPEDVIVEWGDPSQLLAKGIGITDLNSGNFHEVSRKTSTVRITNPTDSQQYVDVERIDEMRLKGENGQEARWYFKNP